MRITLYYTLHSPISLYITYSTLQYSLQFSTNHLPSTTCHLPISEIMSCINEENKMAYTAKDPHPTPWCFLYLRETKSWRWEGREGRGGRGGENVHMLTHATARGVGKNITYIRCTIYLSCTEKLSSDILFVMRLMWESV